MNRLEIEFDDAKAITLMRWRGLWPIMARMVLEDPDRRIAQDLLHSASEERWLAFGLCFDCPACVSFTMRGKVYRIITMFRIHEKEWRKRHD